MTDTVRTWALLLWGAVVCVVVAAGMVRSGPGMEDIWPWAGGLLAFPVGAVVVLLRSRGNTIGRLLWLIATCAGLDFGLSWIAVALDHPWARYADSFTLPASVGIFLGIAGVLHLFPTGHALGRRHRRLLVAIVAWLAIAAVLGLIAPGPVGYAGRPNVLGVAPAWTATLFDAMAIALPFIAVSGLVVLWLRRRAASPVERAQLKWFFAGAAVFAPVLFVVVVSPESSNPWIELGLKVTALVAFWSLPTAIVIAIVRYHLYDIDRLVSRTVAYVVVAGVLSAVYAGSVVALQSLLPADGSEIAVAASTLAVAALFTPLHASVRRRLDRRFNRARYEAAVVTEQYARGLQQEIDLETISADLLGAVARTLQPGKAAVWLRPEAFLGGK